MTEGLSGVAQLTGISRDDLAFRGFAEAVAGIRRVELEMTKVLDAYQDAQERLRSEQRVVVDVEMTPALSAALVEHRVQRGRRAAA